MTLSQPPFRPVVNNNPEKERVRAASSQRAGAQVSPRGGGTFGLLLLTILSLSVHSVAGLAYTVQVKKHSCRKSVDSRDNIQGRVPWC